MYELSVALGVVIAAVRRIDLASLSTLRFRGLWCCVVAFGLKVALFSLGTRHIGWVAAYGMWLQLAVTVTLLVLVALNAHLPGMKLVLVGLLCNLLVIGLNGGKMPATLSALQATGQSDVVPVLQADEDPGHVLANSQTRLPLLADWIALNPLNHKVVSPGDIVVALGLTITVGFTVPSRKQRAASTQTSLTSR